MATQKRSKPTKPPINFEVDGQPEGAAEKRKALQAAERIRFLERQNANLVRSLNDSRTAKPISAIAARTAKASQHSDRKRVILCDNHGSVMDPVAAGTFLSDLKLIDPKEVVHLGDGVDCGGFLAQHHTMGYVAETAYSYEEDISTANKFLDDILNTAGNVETFDYLEGNHERRVETWCVTQTLRHRRDCEMLRQAFAPEFLLRLKQRNIRYYRQGEFYGCRTPGTIRKGKCYFWHGSSAAKHAATVNLAAVGGNVVFGHTHRQQGESAAPVAQGDIGAWNPGCLCRLQPLWNHTRPSQWTTGYALQLVSPTGNFLHINVRIVGGKSLFRPLLQ